MKICGSFKISLCPSRGASPPLWEPLLQYLVPDFSKKKKQLFEVLTVYFPQ